VSTYRKTYEHFLWPFNIENLASTSRVLLLVFKKQRGRPTTKRIWKGDWKRKKTKCSKCYGHGHNIWKCQFAPAINGRQQRAQEREFDSSDSSESLSSGSSSDSGSDVDEEAIMDQIESDLYNQRIARAWEIVNRQQAEWDMESDSELSVLASSLFNGMEGIETGGAELGDVEMGGTSSGPTDQDGQGGEDGQGDGLEDIDGRASGGKATLGAGTSPRRTRSGKEVKYRDQ
jgi:hypothetical protein